ncbi:alpha/beta fold hydrolase [Nocardia sp. NPDC020380]|uniref:alpha/beta fold hydrolase n=1 Tax=Nocardia sp. NPDC020380 TaxID=3364309 RepID=UPI0037BB252B
MKGTGDKGGFTSLPRLLLLPLMTLAVRFDKGDSTRPAMRTVIPTARYDLTLVREGADVWDRLGELHCRTLLLGGDRSIDYLGTALDRLTTVLPDAERVKLAGAGHTVSFTDENPELVAAQLRRFFD